MDTYGAEPKSVSHFFYYDVAYLIRQRLYRTRREEWGGKDAYPTATFK
jgi:hypothetical protein